MKVWEMIRAIEEAVAFKSVFYDGVSDVVFETPDGWQFEVFMDCGEPDYINWVQPPGGERIDMWKRGNDHEAAFLAGNAIHFKDVSARLLDAAKQLTNWDYR